MPARDVDVLDRLRIAAVAAIDHDRGDAGAGGVPKALEVPAPRGGQMIGAVVVACRIVADLRVEVLVGFADDASRPRETPSRETLAAGRQAAHQIDDLVHGWKLTDQASGANVISKDDRE